MRYVSVNRSLRLPYELLDDGLLSSRNRDVLGVGCIGAEISNAIRDRLHFANVNVAIGGDLIKMAVVNQLANLVPGHSFLYIVVSAVEADELGHADLEKRTSDSISKSS